ncbi:hypothetical protein AZA_76218 [Nitrospirillum viridazoti Y2]|uniref:hypothetical protein n=1 Tax=Nitrospirillum viridazoti TaxID=3144925 RepID=UPI000226579F|nr:hypothetical protein [Nitrospirillum amazonense]EGY00939.1 hypothetical protein AZA_76218 [Nitrospirillum amazonense Y2]
MSLLGSFVVFLAAEIAIAAPGPPPPSFILEMTKQISSTQTPATFERYAALLADDLVVTVDGKQVAADKAAWLAAERHRLGKVDRHLLGYVPGRDTILVFDEYDDRSDLPPGPLSDSRYLTRALQYVLGDDHLIHCIRIVQSDGILWSTPRRRNH